MREKTVSARSATEFQVKGKMEERTKGEPDSRRREEKRHAQQCCRDQQRARRMPQASAEKLEHTRLAEKERVASVPQREQLARMPELPLPRGKQTESPVQSTKSRGRRESRWARAGDQSGSMERKGQTPP